MSSDSHDEILLELTEVEAKAVKEWLAFAIRGENSIKSVIAARRVLSKVDKALRLNGIMRRCKPVEISKLASGPTQTFKGPK